VIPARRATLGLLLAAALAACMQKQAPTLSRADTQDLDRITDYLNALPRFEAHFEQTGSFGPGAGSVWLDRPGHLRVDYAGPGARVMVITNGRITVLDRSNGAVTTQPLSKTPLGLLLAPTITLSGPVTVNSLQHLDGGALRLVLARTGQPGQGTLTLDFAEAPLRLRAVSVTDPYGRLLTLALSGIDPAPRVTRELFVPPES
jgi:outer membrane lipoprotein-sorting protein